LSSDITNAFSEKLENFEAAVALNFRVLQLLQDPFGGSLHPRNDGGH
jgi:hypothetical protein